MFKGIAEDVFTLTRVDRSKGGEFKETLLESIRESGLQAEEEYVATILNVNESIANRHGVMIIGNPMVGKTSALKMLSKTHNHLHREEIKERQKDFLIRKALAAGERGRALATPESSDASQRQ